MSSGSHAFQAAPDTPPLESHSALPEPSCMFMEGCDTNSVPRKAVSHVFGRNKMCTRLIPSHVWVRYCRKHYQRAVYRNPKGWPKLQCKLVQEQIKRLDTWTQENIEKGEGGVVKDWTLALRRREQVRRENLVKAGAGGVTTEGGQEDDSEDDEPKHRRSGGHPPIAVPDWLFDLCGSGYSSTEIADIIDAIHQDIINETLPGIPDIELLPTIDTDGEARISTRRSTHRRPTAHQRSQSVGGTLKFEKRGWDSYGEDLAHAHANVVNFTGSSTKRKRREEHSTERNVSPMSQRVRITVSSESPVDNAQSEMDYSNRVAPMNSFISHQPRNHHHHRFTPRETGPISQPPSLFVTCSKSQQYTTSPPTKSLPISHTTTRSAYERPKHHRSQSEIGGSQHLTLPSLPGMHYETPYHAGTHPGHTRGRSWSGETRLSMLSE